MLIHAILHLALVLLLLVCGFADALTVEHNATRRHGFCGREDELDFEEGRRIFLEDLAESGITQPFEKTLYGSKKRNCGRTPIWNWSDYGPSWNCDRNVKARTSNHSHSNTLRYAMRGGVLIEPGQFPSFAKLVIPTNKRFATLCSGTLIGDNVVMTAAHCLDNRVKKFRIEVSLGLTNDRDPEQVIFAKSACQMPTYSNPEYKDDIAVIILEKKVRRTQRVQPACMFKKPANPDSQCFTVGIGQRFTNQQTGEAASIAVQRCDDINGRTDVECYRANLVPLGSTCHGDSGGPTYCIDNCNGKPRQVVVGATSFNLRPDCDRDDDQFYIASFAGNKKKLTDVLKNCGVKLL